MLRAEWLSPPVTVYQAISAPPRAPADVGLGWGTSKRELAPNDRFTLTADVYQRSSYGLKNLRVQFDVPEGLCISTYAGCSRTDRRIECPVNGAPGTYHVSVELSVPPLPSPGEQTVSIRVLADELDSPVTEVATITIVPDLILDVPEVTQSIQTYWYHEVPLLAGRKTWIRVYARSNVEVVNSVRCRLHVYRHSGSSCGAEIMTLEPLTDYQTVYWTYNRADGSQSFIFGLPVEEAHGTLCFKAEINPLIGGSRNVAESNYDNNISPTLVLDFQPSTSTGFAWLQGQYTSGGITYVARASDLDDDLRFMRGVLPFPQVVNLGLAPPQAINLNKYDLTTLTGWESLVNHVAALHDDCEGDPQLCGAAWIVVVPSNIMPAGTCCGGINGMARCPGRDIAVQADVRAGDNASTTAHEFGHNFGLLHADDCNTTDVDPTIPIAIEDYGFNAETLQIYPPGTSELMTYCGLRWLSIESYNRIYDAANAGGATAAAATAVAPGLLVRGSLGLEGTSGAITDAELRERPGGPFTGTGSGAYRLELQDSAGTPLFTRYFTPTLVLGDDKAFSARSFREILPPQPGMAGIVLKHGAQTLDTLAISASAPLVALLAPNGGEIISGTFTARWQATDADGDDLTYSLQLSRDGGQSWQPVTRGLTETTFVLDAAHLPGTSQARLRVVANDGVRAGADVSDANWTVPNHAPEVRIVRPEDGGHARAGSILFLVAEATDSEDLNVGEQVQWSSDRDGSVGNGRELARRNLSVGKHVLTATVADSAGLTATASIQFTITPPIPSPDQCQDRLRNGGFEASGWGAWTQGGNPDPAIVPSPVTTGTHALLLANPSGPDQPGLSWVQQTITLPRDTVHARLSFRYQVQSHDQRDDTDWFLAAITGTEGESVRVLRKHTGNTRWLTATADVSTYAGQTIGLLFAVRNDGQAGATWAYVDDVTLCVSAAPDSALELEGHWLPPAEDYAPAGLPDFDQRQERWQASGSQQCTHDGPVALADLLWWLDSSAESGSSGPPTVSDSHRLVQALGTWDDHDPRNVPPLVNVLASQLNTNGQRPGTDIGDLASGLETYLADRDLADDYALALRRSPSFDWVREEVRQQHPLLLLLGFWELQPGGWKRLGGHSVAVAGASSGDEEWIALSDPFRDAAELGWPGLVKPGQDHGHLPDGGQTVHNDAAFVSHDVYGLTRTTNGWGPQGYARASAQIANFAGLNSAPGFQDVQATASLHGEIVTLVDYALAISPQPASVALRLSPAISHVHAGETFLAEIEVQAGNQPVDRVRAHLDFDPSVLRVVDDEGNPATKVISGRTLTEVRANSVDNAIGRIDYVAEGGAAHGRFAAAVVRFQAITATLASRLTFGVEAPRASDLSLAGRSVLDHLRGGLVMAGPGAWAVGQAQMQRQATPPSPTWQVPLLLTLSRPGERGPAYVYSSMSSQTGSFPMPGAADPGTYRTRLKGLHTLRNLNLSTLLHAGANTLNMGTLLEGDVLGDNRVDGRDVSRLAASFGKSRGEAGFDPRADLNQDGQVNAQDLELLRPNLGRRGDVLVGVGAQASSLQQDVGEALDLVRLSTVTTGTVSLRLVPASASAPIDGQVVLEVRAGAGSQPFDTAELHLDYDPAALLLVDGSGQPATAIEPGSALSGVLLNTVDPARGWIDYLATSLGSTPPTGDIVIARLRFQVLKAAIGTVRFSLSDWRCSDLTYQGQSVLGSLAAAEIEGGRAAPGYGIHLPVVLKQYRQ